LSFFHFFLSKHSTAAHASALPSSPYASVMAYENQKSKDHIAFHLFMVKQNYLFVKANKLEPSKTVWETDEGFKYTVQNSVFMTG
jgi:hypothetical protein